jgi:choice-of-anchor A domain-containing protein
MRLRRALPALPALIVVGVAVAGATAAAPPPRATAAACASLGVAEPYTVFSHGVFTAAGGGGTTITGRIAAAGDVTLDAVTVGPAAGDEPPTVTTGGDFIAGLGAGGTVNGGVRYQGAYTVAPNFTVNGDKTHAAPPFSFNDAFNELGLLSDTWSELSPTPGATVTFAYGALTFNGVPGGGLNVFKVDAADVNGGDIQGLVFNLPGPNASALVNVTTDANIVIAPQYMSVNPAGAQVIWNLPRATGLAVNHGVALSRLILAPNAVVTGEGHPQLAGQLIAKSVPGGVWVFTRAALADCPPAPTPTPTPTVTPTPSPGPQPDPTLDLEALCVDPFGNLAMRLRNLGDRNRPAHWDDLGGTDFGDVVARAQRDEFFNVRDGGAHSDIRVVAGDGTASAKGTDERCAGDISITKQVTGEAPAGPWTIALDGADGREVRSAQLAAGQSATFDALGGYQPGSARFGQVVGGVVYTVREDDPLGGTATISLNPVEILTDHHEEVIVNNAFAGTTPPVDPVEPTTPPGAPDPPPGPPLEGGTPGTPLPDLVVTHSITPSKTQLGGVIRTVTRVRNAGPVAAMGAVLREIPQYRAADANSVARVLSESITSGHCTKRRPVRCALGTLAPGAEVVLRTRTRILVAANLRSVVFASSQSRESNTTNNTGLAPVTATEPDPHLRVAIAAPPRGRVGVPLDYVVSVTGTGADGARYVRLCAPPSDKLTGAHAFGTFAFHGARCRDIRRLGRGRTVSFTVTAVPAAGGRLTVRDVATAVGISSPARASDQVLVAGPVACGAALLRC